MRLHTVGVVALVAVPLVGAVGCGGASQDSAFESEVRGAMEMIGDFVDTRDALRRAERLNGKAKRCLAAGDAACAEMAIGELERLQKQADRLQRNVNFDRYSRRVFTTAMRRVQAEGLVGQGCSREATGWVC